MSQSGTQDLDQATPKVEDDPRPRSEAGNAEKADVAPAPAPPAAAVSAEQDVIRSVYVSRNVVTAAATAGGFAMMETTEQSLSVRGAYLAHLSEDKSEAIGDRDLLGDDLLRRAFVQRSMVDAQPARRAGAAKRAAVAPGRKAVAKKAKPKLQARRKASAGGKGKTRRARAAKRARR